jgi:hypothetical protein
MSILHTLRAHIRPVAVARLLAAASLFAVGGVHIQQYIVQDYRVIPTIGPLFLFNFIGATALGLYFLIPAGSHAGRLRFRVDSLAALTGSMVAGGALVALLISEHTPLFGFMEHGYRFAIVFAIVSESVAVLTLSVFLALNRRAARTDRNAPRRGRKFTVVRTADTTGNTR